MTEKEKDNEMEMKHIKQTAEENNSMQMQLSISF